MQPIAIFYGTSTSNTEEAARYIADALGKHTATPVELINVARMSPERLLDFDRFIVGCPTWDIGELQGDWDRIHRKLGDLDFSGKTIALFGCGDAVSYPDTFQDAIGILGKDFRDRGATLIGSWPTDGYDFEAAIGVEGDHFMGLALDYDNDYKIGQQQIETWAEQIAGEFGVKA